MAESVGPSFIVITIMAMAAMFASPLYALIWFRIRVRRFPETWIWCSVVAYYFFFIAGALSFTLTVAGQASFWSLAFPCFALPGSFAGPFIAAWIVEKGRLTNRYPFGHCQSCGYDLTGNVSGVCPECGARVA